MSMDYVVVSKQLLLARVDEDMHPPLAVDVLGIMRKVMRWKGDGDVYEGI